MTVAATIDEENDLAKYRETWDSLFLKGTHEPSSSHEWMAALATHHLRANDRLWMLAFHDAGKTVGLVPMVTTRERILGCQLVNLSPLSERYNTHSEVLTSLDPDACAQALLAAIFALPTHWDVIRIGRLLESNSLGTCLATHARNHGTTAVVQYQPPSFFLPLPDSFPDYLAQRSGKFRNHLRRIEKKLLARGDLCFLEVTEPAAFETAYAHVLDIESHSWKHLHGTAISAIARQSDFYRDMGRAAAQAGRLHLSLLYLRDRPIAYNLGYLHNRQYSYLKTSYHEAFREDGVATYARARLIERLIEAGIRFFDFPGEPYEWEQQWASELRWHQSIAIYNKTLPAHLYLNLWRLRGCLKPRAEGKVLEFCKAQDLQPPAK